MSERVKLAEALVERMLHPLSPLWDEPLTWRNELERVTKQGIGAAMASRDHPDALGITAAAMRLCGTAGINAASDVVTALRESVDQIERISKT
jgi:hypothetical protein